MDKVLQLLYDCKVFFCKYNREPVKNKIYEDIYYEVVNGLQAVNINLNREAMGNATVSLFVPLSTQNTDNSNTLLAYNINPSTTPQKGDASDYIYKYSKSVTVYNNSPSEASISLNQSFSALNTPDGQYIVNTQPSTQNSPAQSGATDTGKTFNNVNGQSISKNNNPATVLNLFASETLLDEMANPINVIYNPLLNSTFTECVFKPMDKVKIFMSNRFQGKSIDDDSITSINTDSGYAQVFEGLIGNTNVTWADGGVNITISANDSTRWLDLSQYNVNPAIAFQTADTLFASQGIKPFDISFAGMTLEEIINILVTGNQKSKIEVSENEYNAALLANPNNSMFTTETVTDNPPVPDAKELANITSDVLNQTLARLKASLIDNGTTYEKILPIADNGDDYAAERKPVYANISYGHPTLADIDTIILNEGLNADNVRLTATQINAIIKKDTKIKTRTAYFMKIGELDGVGDFRLLNKGEGLYPNESSGLQEIRLETDFTKDKLWIDPNIVNFVPYIKAFQNFDLFNYSAGRRKKLEIIKEVCAINEVEFFMDANGILVCKIPDYNLNPGFEINNIDFETGLNSTGYQKETDNLGFIYNDDRYIIKPQEVMDYSKNISDASIANYCIVEGQYDFKIDNVALSCTDWQFDATSCAQYGVRIITKAMPLLAGIQNSDARQIFARAFMNRQNAKYKSITTTIPLRPELKLGRTVAFLPADGKTSWNFGSVVFYSYVNFLNSEDISEDLLNTVEVGYLSQINHNWVAGGLCTTKLNLSHVRLWNQNFGCLAYTRINTDDLANLTSRIQDKLNLAIADVTTYQTELNKLATKDPLFNVGTPDGIMGKQGSHTQNAIQHLCTEYDLVYNPTDPLTPEVRTQIRDLITLYFG